MTEPRPRSLHGKEILLLMREGVSLDTLSMEPSIQIANVNFDAYDNFEFDEAGAPAFIFEVWECGRFIDYVAWDPEGEMLASWRNAAFSVVQDVVANPGTYALGGQVSMYSSVLHYLCG